LKKALQHFNAASPNTKLNEPHFEFHPPTKLLIAVGSEPELAILTQIVQALGGTSSGGAMPGFPADGAPGPPGYAPGSIPFLKTPGVPGLEGVAPSPRRR
jgi:hypothetical protein